MTSAPSVNQIRFFSSVAFENAPKFILAASCSAADAMVSYPWPQCGPYRRRGGAGSAPPTRARSGWRRLALALGPGRAADDDLAPGRLDGGNCRLGRAGHLDRDRGGQLALRKQADAVAGAAQYPGRDKRRRIDRPLGAEPPRIDRLLQSPEIDDLIILPEDLVAKAALRQAAMQRRLAALEPVKRDAGARSLPLAAASR